jgi:hypothetical protein
LFQSSLSKNVLKRLASYARISIGFSVSKNRAAVEIFKATSRLLLVLSDRAIHGGRRVIHSLFHTGGPQLHKT